MINFEVAKRINCTADEKHGLLALIEMIVQISDDTAKGIIIDEQYLNNYPQQIPFLLKKGLMLVRSGIDSQTVTDILNNYIVAGNYEGAELLKRIIICDGVKCIQRGDSAAVIREFLTAYLGEDFVSEYDSVANYSIPDKQVIRAIAGKNAINTYNRNIEAEKVMNYIRKLYDIEDSVLAERLEIIEPQALEPLLAVSDEALKNRIINLLPEDKRNSLKLDDTKHISVEDVQLSLLHLGILPDME